MLLSVRELDQRRDFGVPKDKPKKLDHLNLGPAAGEGLPDRLQCQGCINSVPAYKSLIQFYLLEITRLPVWFFHPFVMENICAFSAGPGIECYVLRYLNILPANS